MPECGERVTLAMQPGSRVMARVLSGTHPGPRRPGWRMSGTTATSYFGVVVIAATGPQDVAQRCQRSVCLLRMPRDGRPPFFRAAP